MADSPRIEELKRRVQLDPASIAFAALAEEYRRTGRYEEAIEVCRTGIQRHPSYISAHVTLGRALFEVGHYDDARRELEYVLSVAPENLAAIRGLAEIHHRKRQSHDSSDLTATEMADMLAVPHPGAPTRPEPRKEPPLPVEPFGDTPAPPPPAIAAPEPSPAVIEMAQPEPPAIEPPVSTPPVADVPVPEPAREREREPEPELMVVDAEANASTVDTVPVEAVVIPFEPPAEDPALERLETFLHAILRARESAGGIHAS
jgi:hypothetical protein